MAAGRSVRKAGSGGAGARPQLHGELFHPAPMDWTRRWKNQEAYEEGQVPSGDSHTTRASASCSGADGRRPGVQKKASPP